MDLYEVMRTAFSARQFADEPVPDAVLATIIDNARFASSGGNRQGWRVVIVREPSVKAAIAQLQLPAVKLYMAQVRAGENPFNTIVPTALDAASVEQTVIPDRLISFIANAPVVLVVCVDLNVVASIDRDLPRVGVISGASIYPFVWNMLLAARNEGYGGTLTTWATIGEREIQELLGIPPYCAVSAIIPFGRPLDQPKRLKRKPLSEIAVLERWDGTPLTKQS